MELYITTSECSCSILQHQKNCSRSKRLYFPLTAIFFCSQKENTMYNFLTPICGSQRVKKTTEGGAAPSPPQGTSPLTHYRALPGPVLGGARGNSSLSCPSRRRMPAPSPSRNGSFFLRKTPPSSP